MAQSLNKVQLIGRVGKDPEIRNTSNGNACANFSVATSESWKDKRSGEKKEKTEWHNVVVWNEGTVKFIEDYVHKGDLVYVEGQMQTRKWEDKDGNDRYSTEVVVQAFGGAVSLLHSKDGGNDREDRDDRGSRDSKGRGSNRSSSRDDGRDADRDDRRASSSRSRNRDEDDDGDRGSRRSRGDDKGDRGSRVRDDDRDSGRSGRSNNRARAAAADDMDDEIPF
jgi:single-strand DNA-binding protein